MVVFEVVAGARSANREASAETDNSGVRADICPLALITGWEVNQKYMFESITLPTLID